MKINFFGTVKNNQTGILQGLYRKKLKVNPDDIQTRLRSATTYLRLLIGTLGLKLENDPCSLPECTTLIFKFFSFRRILTKLFMSSLSSQVNASKSRDGTIFSTYFASDGFVTLIWNRKGMPIK
jgi:hypothetical protein